MSVPKGAVRGGGGLHTVPGLDGDSVAIFHVVHGVSVDVLLCIGASKLTAFRGTAAVGRVLQPLGQQKRRPRDVNRQRRPHLLQFLFLTTKALGVGGYYSKTVVSQRPLSSPLQQ